MKRRTNILLWSAQILLAALFLFAGYAKLNMPGDVLAKASGLPATFMQFIAVCELLGGIGLVLPGMLRIRRELTPVAACGLIIIMIGATSLTLHQHQYVGALVPFVVGLLAATVARKRWSWIASAASTSHATLRRAA